MHLYPEIDTRPVLPSICVPTLVIHRRAIDAAPVAWGRYLAEPIPGARYVELEGDRPPDDRGDPDAILDEVEEFLTGARHDREPDRVLATVMFTDIVSSTERAARAGRQPLARRCSRATTRSCGGSSSATAAGAVKTLGDGFLATFDGPARGDPLRRGDPRRACGRSASRSAPGCTPASARSMGDDVGGMAVHIGARVRAKAEPGEVLVSSTVKDLVVGSGIEFAERGTHVLKGVPGEWRLYAVAAQRCPSGRRPPYSGMFPCLRFGVSTRLVWSVSSARISFGRVSCGTITSSM